MKYEQYKVYDEMLGEIDPMVLTLIANNILKQPDILEYWNIRHGYQYVEDEENIRQNFSKKMDELAKAYDKVLDDITEDFGMED